MKKSILIILALVILSAIVVAANDWPAKLRVINQSDQPVVVNLGYPYQYLYVAAGADKTFHIEKDEYTASVWYCGDEIGSTMDITRSLRLRFKPCSVLPGTRGESSMEKVDLDNGPKRDFQFQY
jgi:hypothetical protein